MVKQGQKGAAHRTYQGKSIVRSATCPHMACVVNWSDAEQTWDCPCHGSRFEPDGSVLEGPAYKPLHEIETKDE